MSLNRCRIVLVEPRIAANLGATARVMHNFGLADLVLVAPHADVHDRDARKLSTQGEFILDQARVVPDFAEAVADCFLVVGTSARIGGPVRRQSVGYPEEILPHLVAALAQGPAALVFGREANGLTDAEVTRCNYLMHIPTAEVYSALNLAQAVAISLYVMHRIQRLSHPPPSDNPLRAAFAHQEHMYRKLQEALEEIHFLYGPKAEALMHSLRHLLGRAALTEMEVDLLLGLARQIHWFVQKNNER